MTTQPPDVDREVPSGGGRDDDEMPRPVITRDRAILFAVFVASVTAFLYFVLPRIGGKNGLKSTWHRLHDGSPGWIALCIVFELLSFGGYVWLFRAVFIRNRGRSRIGWRESYQITMAGLAATRLFAAAGAGGIALTAWALRKSGMERRVVAQGMIAFNALLYLVYVGAVVIAGLGVRTGLFHGERPAAATLLPALVGVGLLIGFFIIATRTGDVERRLEKESERTGRFATMSRRLAAMPRATAGGIREALALARSQEPGVLGAVAWWGFDIGVLWAAFHAFGDPPPFAVLVLCYFIGMLANTLPLPGGIGGVDGGMIGTLIAFGVDSGLAIVAVLVYRGFSFWLPTIPGAIAYFQLRRTVARWGDTIHSEATPRTETVNV